MIRYIAIFVGSFILLGCWISPPIWAKPLQQGGTPSVRVCYSDTSCNSPTVTNTDKPPSFVDYIEHVLANEWHSNANLEALKAGSVAIRTFSYRNNPCGAIKNTFPEPNTNPVVTSTVLDNRTQVYKNGGQGGSQKPVTTNHTTAQSQTSSVLLYRTDNVYACAKYNANNGNPTKSCASASCTTDINDRDTLLEIVDPVDTNNLTTIGPRYAVGMSQNGSVAWSLGYSPWSYRQILTHYYTKVKFGVFDDPKYRWTWLNTGIATVHIGYEGARYVGSVPAAPVDMRTGVTYQVRMTLQNAGTEPWTYVNASNSYKLIYQWCDTNGSNCGAAVSTALATFNPGAVGSVYLYLTAPAQTGTRLLKWDVTKPDGTLFSTYQSHNWPTQNVTVDIRSTSGNTFLPWAASSASGPPPSH